MRVRIQVNEASTSADVAPGATLSGYLRDHLGLTGTKEGCGRGECGACTVLLGGRPVMSCVQLAAETRDPVTTIEGLAGDAYELREAFADHYGFQCGFCTPGQIVRAEALLRQTSGPLTRDVIRSAMSGNICRCTGYHQIVDAVVAVAQARGRYTDESTEGREVGGS